MNILKKIWTAKGVALFFLILAFIFLFLGMLGADEWKPNTNATINYLYECRHWAKTIDKPTPEQKKIWKKEYDNHHKEGLRCYKEAKDLVWYMPNTTCQQKAKNCFVAAIAAISCSNPGTALTAGVLALLTQHGLDCMDEWNYINYKLNWALHHFEMCDFYRNLLDQA